MSYNSERGGRRLPTLVHYCQRVASAHVNNLERLGEGLPNELIHPILTNCTAETLERFEDEDPYISEYTSGVYFLRMWGTSAQCHFGFAEIWRTLAHKTYAMYVSQPAQTGSESWKEEYFRCKEENDNRLERASAKLRSTRQTFEEKKKESSIKITDKLPPAKRARWGGPSQPRTLFQKTRHVAARMQKGVFSNGRTVRYDLQKRPFVGNTYSAKPPPLSTSTPSGSGSRVTVRAVAVPRKPPPAVQVQSVAPPQAVMGGPMPVASSSAAAKPAASSLAAANTSTSAASPPATSPPQMPASPSGARSPPRPGGPAKKNPASTLFMPKHRAYSQLPRGVKSKT
ncbi:hypothetical protein BD413DRAFT_607742 [Trametes elegans]|nr:hypothetical protein BD413DRAFT_607742 [Trametes elegans]